MSGGEHDPPGQRLGDCLQPLGGPLPADPAKRIAQSAARILFYFHLPLRTIQLSSRSPISTGDSTLIPGPSRASISTATQRELYAAAMSQSHPVLIHAR